MLGKATNPNTMTPHHLMVLNEVLIDVAKGITPRVILTFPPRHGKSETTSRLFPAWYVGMNPWHRVMLISYAAEFAATWGRKTRDLMEEYGPRFFNVKMRDDVRAKDAWEVMERTVHGFRPTIGGMVTAGIGGPITGKGGDLIIVDDPIKNQEEAFSQHMRDKNWDWFKSTLMSRAEPGAKAIVIQTRWHEDDLAGRLIQQTEDGDGESWQLINFPALAGPNDVLGRAEGEALWPERYSRERLLAVQADQGSYWFSALYQQSPIPAGDALFKPEDLCRYIRNDHGVLTLIHRDGSKSLIQDNQGVRFTTVDLAASLKQSADFTVVSTWQETPYGDLILLDVKRLRMEGPDQVPLLMRTWQELQPRVFYIENVGYQLTIIQAALRAGLPVRPLTPDTDKVSRALSPAAKMEAGKIFFPMGAPWLQDVESELWRFPAGAHDDFVDTLSMASLASLGVGYVGNLG